MKNEEIEDGMGYSGLVPTAQEKIEEREAVREAARCKQMTDELKTLRSQNEQLAKEVGWLRESMDIDICRLQLPDGTVPTDTVNCARAWHKEAHRFWKERDALKVQLETNRGFHKNTIQVMHKTEDKLKEAQHQLSLVTADRDKWQRMANQTA